MDSRQLIALEYLETCARRLDGARTFEARQEQARLRLHFLGLARRYGVCRAECARALRVTLPHLDQLLELV
jgi:hypothetical protein